MDAISDALEHVDKRMPAIAPLHSPFGHEAFYCTNSAD